MSSNQYLTDVLNSQTLSDKSDEVKSLRQKRAEVEDMIRDKFDGVSIRYAGSYAKNTMIKASYDLDVTCYFSSDNNDTLSELHESVVDCLKNEYIVEPKTSSIQLKETASETYTHIDVVPGKFIDEETGDVFLYQNKGDKKRLKTNLKTHIDTIKGSALTDVIRLSKYWRECSGLRIKTFVLELLVVEILKDHVSKNLEDKMTHLLEILRDDIDSISIEDPANPTGNDLSEILDEIKPRLSQAALTTLLTVDASGWEAVFGDVSEETDSQDRQAAIVSFPKSRPSGAKPWSHD